jgi:integrase
MYILFWFRKSESKSEISHRKQNPKHDTLGNISCRITVEGIAVEVGNVHIECRKSAWDSENQRLIGTDYNTKRHNRTIAELRIKLERLYEILSIEHEHVTASMVKDFYTGRRLLRYSFEQLIQEYFKDRAAMVQMGKITESTQVIQKNYARNFQDFLENARLKNTAPTSFDEPQLDQFKTYLTQKNLGPAHTRKHCVWVKALFKHSLKKKRLKHNPIAGYEIEGDGVIPDTTHLAVEQLKKLAEFDFGILVQQGYIQKITADKCERERDAFVFNCFTGMHHCDYADKNFKIERFQDAFFLKGYRRKTKKEFMVKLLEPAVKVLEKYDMCIEKLPSISNQKRNGTLKQVAILTKTPILMTTKIARKTFADIALNELLMDTSDVQACLGLTSDKYLRHYVRIREQRLMQKMSSWNEVLKKSDNS